MITNKVKDDLLGLAIGDALGCQLNLNLGRLSKTTKLQIT